MPAVYIHELIDIIGHNRARYVQHMTANWVPIALEERGQRCLGVWATVGSTGAWPQVVNMWELDGWEGLARNLDVELAGGRDQDPSLAEWWAVAATLRRGGIDRIVVAEPGTRTVDQLIDDGVRGERYAHELITVPPGAAPDLLDALAADAVPAYEALGLTHVGTYRVAMVNDSEVIALWALPSTAAWIAFEQACTGRADVLEPWRRAATALGADWRRTLLVDAPLSPLRLGRQPAVSDRVPLDQL
jgi:hypothetical protein